MSVIYTLQVKLNKLKRARTTEKLDFERLNKTKRQLEYFINVEN